MNRFKRYKSMVKPFDIGIAVLLMVLSFTPMAVFAHHNRHIPANADRVAVISINAQEAARIYLSEDTPHEVMLFNSEHGLSGNQFNIVEVEGLQIRVKEDNSPDQIAVLTGWISRPGEMSICLPHRLMIRIESVNLEVDPDGVIPAG